jgi:subtilisin family serine protease
MFKKSHTHDAHFKTIGNDLSTSDAYHHYSYGYTMNLTDSSLMNAVRKDPGVLLVETNREASLPPAAFEPVEESYLQSMSRHAKRYSQNTVTNAWYGLQIVAAGSKLSTPVNNNGNYDFVNRAGEGVNCYVLDSGIRITHKAFQGRASNFGGAASNDVSPYAPGQVFYDDKFGHGTQ